MRGRAARLAAAGLAAAVIAGLAGCGNPEPGTELGPEGFAEQLFNLTNDEREAEGLEPLVWNDCLEAKAAERAAPLEDSDELEHEVLAATCLDDAMAGENLSRSDRTAPQVMEAWMASAGHRANLLREEFTAGAVACVDAGNGVLGCAQLFEGVPASE
mgnify:FL=1